MRSLIRQSKACRDSGTDQRERERDPRASQYVEDLKRRCADSCWNLVEIDFTRSAEPVTTKPESEDNQQ